MPNASSSPLMRALADASARWARSAPPVMLRASATAMNSFRSTRSKRISDPASVISEGRLRKLHIVLQGRVGQCRPMTDPLLIFIAFALTLAGFVKGALGLGLPTISVGLLAIAMPPGRALAIVIVPAVITNIWQTFAGPYLRDIAKRLWPLMAGTAIGICLNAGADRKSVV